MHLILIPVFLISAWGCVAAAQTSLGRGDGLDKNRQSTTNTNPKYQLPVGTLNNEIRGSGVLQGRGFNEGIGRTTNDGLQLLRDAESLDEDEFQDALNNSPWYWNNWDQQSAQFLLQGDKNYFNPNFTDEWSMAPKQMHKGRTIRTYSHGLDEESVQNQDRGGELEYPDHWSQRQVQQYRLGQALGSGNMQPASMDVSPIHLSSFRNLQNVGYLTASSLAGVSVETSDRAFQGLGFSTWDAARLEEDRALGLFDESIVIAWRQEETLLNQRVAETELVSSPQYNGLLNSIADRTQDVTSQDEVATTEILNAAYIILQNQLVGIPFDDEEEDELVTSTEPIVGDGDAEEIPEENPLEYLSGILRHGERVSQFSGGQETRFNELMREAEMSLAKEEYFLAKKRFDQALRFVPGHPLGTAGLGHANIGAGLYLSAGHVLQSLLSLQPEMIDVMYDPQLLPPRLELVRAGVTIQQRLDEERDGMTYAFLLAYIGHQIHDNEMLKKGIEALERGQEDSDPFVPLLRNIWLPIENP